MANQAIALGARAPQPIDLGAATARFGNMMSNMAVANKQRNDMARANQLRSLIASGVDITTPEGFNQVASLDPQAAAALRKSAEETAAASRKREDDLLVKHRNLGVAVNNQGTWDRWINGLKADDPTHAAQFAEFMGPTFDQAKMNQILSTADQYINKNIPTARTDVQLDEEGNPGVVYSGGYDPARIVRPKTFEYGNTPAPTAPAPQAENAPVTSADAERFIASFPAALQPAIRERVMRGDLGNIPMGNPAPSGGGRGGMGGPYEAVDQMPVRASSTQDGMVSNLGPEGLVETKPFRAKNPMQSPLPGSAQVPISRVRAEAVAGRETPDEVYQKEKARRRAEREDALLPQPVKPLTPLQDAKLRDNITKDYKSARATIGMMDGVVRAISDVRNLSPDQKEAITGWSGYAPSLLPSSRSADTKLKNLQGKVTEMGKSAASLTGAIGQMAVQEWRIVSDMIASLDVTGMEPADLNNQLDIIEGQARRAASITRDAYENQYAEEFARYPGRFQLDKPTAAPVAAARGPARVKSDADYARLKPGTIFIGPDGKQRRKP